MKNPLRRSALSVVLVALGALGYFHFRPRPLGGPLATEINGPPPSRATRVLVFLHGVGGDLGAGEKMAERLRAAGLPADVSIVLLEGPYGGLNGHHWGQGAEEQALSRARIRARLTELLARDGGAPAWLVVSGFSQGAGVAADLAAEDHRIGAMASFSPCAMWLRGDLPKRGDLRILLAHGRDDDVCPVNESRSLADALRKAEVQVEYLEFAGGHTVPEAAVRALVALVTDQAAPSGRPARPTGSRSTSPPGLELSPQPTAKPAATSAGGSPHA